ncbi:MAG: PQQ-dependent sugar dehydrogenase [Limisphaerales bacterium]
MRRLWTGIQLVMVIRVLAMPGFAGISLRLPSNALVEGLAVGAATRAYEAVSLREALDGIRRTGVAVVEIHAGQKMGIGSEDVSIGEGMSEEQTLTLRRHATGAGLRLVSARVRFGNNAGAITRLFEWADRLGLQVLVGDPPAGQLDHVERMVRQYNIAVALPTAGGQGGGGRSGWTDPKTIAASLRGRDPRIGVMIQVLNLVRAGGDPLEAVEDLRTRLIGVQVVDYAGTGSTARAVPFGTGRLQVRRLLTALQAQRFDGYVVFDPPPGAEEFKGDLELGLGMVRKEMESIRRENRLWLAARGANVADGLRYEVLVQGDIAEPVHVEACPDGTLWFASRRGSLWSWDPENSTKRLVGRFPVSTSGQRGLYAFQFDPGFLTNGFVYFSWAPMVSVGNTNRVSRFTATGNRGAWTVGIDTERILLDIPSSDHGLQQGGALLWHPRERLLYVGTGDNTPPDETARVYDDPASPPQDLGDLRGKILRIDPDGKVPTGNPFVSTPRARPEVYAFGLRNPLTLSWNEPTGDILVGDVGYDRRRDFEEVNRLRPGANFGWPRCDGRNLDTLSGAACPIPEAVAPWFSYPHDSAAAVMVGPAILQPAVGWPDSFGAGFFYSDYSRRIVRFAQTDARFESVTNTLPVVSGLTGGVLSMALAPDGALNLIQHAGSLGGGREDRFSRVSPK